MLLWATKKGWACDELPPMALAAGTFFFSNGGGRRFKSHHGFFLPKRNLYIDFFWGKNPCLKSMEPDFILVLLTQWWNWHFPPSVYEKKKIWWYRETIWQANIQISKASRNAWALLARMGDEEWLVVVHLLTFHPQISSVSAPADYTIHDSRMVIISRIIWPNYRIC